MDKCGTARLGMGVSQKRSTSKGVSARESPVCVATGRTDDPGPAIKFVVITYEMHPVDGLTNAWSAAVPPEFPPEDLAMIDAQLLQCEQRGVSSLDEPYASRDELPPPDVTRLLDAGVSAHISNLQDGKSGVWLWPPVPPPASSRGSGDSMVGREMAAQLPTARGW